MRRDAPRIGVEVILVGLVLASLAGALGLVARAHRSVAKPPVARPVVAVEPSPVALAPDPAPPPPPEPSPIDLTPARLAAIAAKVTAQKARGEAADRRAEGVEEAANASEIVADTWEQRSRALQSEATDREIEADRAEAEKDALARQRDALVAQRDDTRASLDQRKLRARDGVAVLPYKGPNGTWRRPIAIECGGGAATLRPGGASFTLTDLAAFGDPRSNPMVLAVAKTMLRTRSIATPDGAMVEPYILFVIRPDGIRPYYAARTILEPLGIAFGYELADADWDIEFPDLNDPAEWGETARTKKTPTWPPPPSAVDRPAGAGTNSRNGSRGGAGIVGESGSSGRGLADGNSPRPGANRDGRGTTGTGATRLVEGGGIGRSGRSEGWAGSGLEDAEPERLGDVGGSLDSGDPPIGSGWPGSVLRPRNPRESAEPSRSGGGVPTPATQDGESKLPNRERHPSDVAPNGRDPGQPGLGDGPPTFDPAPPSDGHGIDRGEPHPGASNGGSKPNAGRALSERIARREGLVAPTMPNLPSRSGGGSAAAVAGGSVPDRRAGRESSAGSGSNDAAGGESSASSSGASGGGVGGSGDGAGGAGGWVQPGSRSRSLPITVACDRSGATVYPGAVRVPIDAILRDDSSLSAKLRAIVAANQAAEPEVGFRPRVTFLVKPGGEATYLKARWQAATGTNYPQSLRMVEPGAPRLPVWEAQ